VSRLLSARSPLSVKEGFLLLRVLTDISLSPVRSFHSFFVAFSYSISARKGRQGDKLPLYYRNAFRALLHLFPPGVVPTLFQEGR